MIDTAQDAPETVWVAGDEASLYLREPGSDANHQVASGARAHPFLWGFELAHRSGNCDAIASDECRNLRSFSAKTVVVHFRRCRLLLLWDRAPWHYGPHITAILEANPRLVILRLPTAAPDLNPQEQVWKATRQAVSHNHASKKLDTLADDFETHLTTTTFPCSLLQKYDYLSICMMFK